MATVEPTAPPAPTVPQAIPVSMATVPVRPPMKVNFKISCKNLPDLDVVSKSDPMVVVYENRDDAGWREIDRTEMIKDSLNPEFTKMIRMEYHFETRQKIKFEVYDVDVSPVGSLDGNDYIGYAEILLSDIITERRCHYVEELAYKDKKGRGTIFVVCEEDDGSDDVVEMKIKGEDLDKKDLFGKSDPYFILYRKMPNGSYSKVYRSATIMKTLNPSWDAFHVRIWDLCGKDMNQEIKAECFDWDRFSSDDLIGITTFTLEKIISPGSNKSFELINPKYKATKKKYSNSGKLVIESAKLVKVPSFIEFLRGGLEISLMVAIDFTGSNGNPSFSNSLHYINPDGSDNAYMKAIRSVGSILAAYDKDQMFPAYGYGAKFPDGKISHCFPLNGNKSNPEVCGIDGVMSAYKETLTKIKLWGPTYFRGVIRNASKIAKEEMEKNPYKYFVLLILTDGAINDMDETIDTIVEAANNYPLSIVITGIGNAPFGPMNRLDSDGNALTSSKGVIARRDIVQFVPFNRCCESPYLLAQETLAEIPRQVSDYMVMKGLLPSPVLMDENGVPIDGALSQPATFNAAVPIDGKALPADKK